MKQFDKEIQALSGKIKHHLSHQYGSDENQSRNLAELISEYKNIILIPILEISQDIWDELDFLAEKALIK